MWTRELFEQLRGLDEGFTFWCSDNVTVQQLIKRSKSHILVTASVVHHIGRGSNTINVVDSDTTYQYTVAEIKKFNARYNANVLIEKDWTLPHNLKKTN